MTVGMLVSGCVFAPRADVAEQAWMEVETPHFRLWVPGDEAKARKLAQRLERVRQAVLAALGAAAEDVPGQVEVVLLDDDGVTAYLPKGVGGLTLLDSLGGPLLVGDDTPGFNPIMSHELVHVLVRPSLRRAPLWLEEGLAFYLTTLELRPDGAEVGRPEEAWWTLAASQPLDLENLFTTDAASYRAGGPAGRSFAARSWLLAHLLVDRHPDLLASYLARLAEGEGRRAAWDACCGATLDPRTLEAEARTYARQGRPRTRALTLAPLPEASPGARALGGGEVKALLARLLALQHPAEPARAALADRLTAEALASDPGNPLAGRALCALKGQGSADCAAAATAAARAHPADVRSQLLLMAVHAARGDREGFRTALRAAEALAPTEPSVLVGLAHRHLEEGRRDAAAEAARQAARSASGRLGVLLDAAAVMVSLGDCASATAWAREAEEAASERTLTSGAATRDQARAVTARCRR